MPHTINSFCFDEDGNIAVAVGRSSYFHFERLRSKWGSDSRYASNESTRTHLLCLDESEMSTSFTGIITNNLPIL